MTSPKSTKYAQKLISCALSDVRKARESMEPAPDSDEWYQVQEAEEALRGIAAWLRELDEINTDA